MDLQVLAQETERGVDRGFAPVRVNRPAIVLMITAAALIGSTPATLFMERPGWLIVFASVSALTSVITVWRYQTPATEKPTTLEFLLATLSTVFPMAFTGALWMFFYTAGVQIASWINRPQLGSFVFWFTAVWAVVFTAAFSDASETAKELYPKTVGFRSRFYPLIMQRRTLLRGAGILLLIFFTLVGVAVLMHRTGTHLFYVLLELYLFIAGVTVYPSETESDSSRKEAESNVIGQIARVFEGGGYEVERSPRTNKPDVDPLLSELDLLVHKGDDWLAIEIKAGSEASPPVDWKAVSALRTAAWTLSDARHMRLESVRCMLVLVDATADKSLKAGLRREHTLLVTLTGQSLAELSQKGADKEKLAKTVAQWTEDRTSSLNPRLAKTAEPGRKQVPLA
jgi:hypothetical protein